MEIKCSVCGTIIKAGGDMRQHISRGTEVCSNPDCVRSDIMEHLTLGSLSRFCEESGEQLIALQVLLEGIQSLSPYQLDEIAAWFADDYIPCINGNGLSQSA